MSGKKVPRNTICGEYSGNSSLVSMSCRVGGSSGMLSELDDSCDEGIGSERSQGSISDPWTEVQGQMYESKYCWTSGSGVEAGVLGMRVVSGWKGVIGGCESQDAVKTAMIEDAAIALSRDDIAGS